MSQHRERRPYLRMTMLVAAAMAVAVPAASAAGLPSPTGIRVGPATNVAQAAAAPAAATMLGGVTSKHWPVVVAISPDRKRIRYIAIGLDMQCTSGAAFGLNAWFLKVPIAANGAVRATYTVPPQTGSGASITGGSESLTGRFNRSRLMLSGSWKLHLDFQLQSGQSDHCDSGRVTFTTQL